MAKQPWGITLATILLAFGGIVTIMGALMTILLGVAIPITTIAITGMLAIMGLLYLAFGAAYLAVAYFLYFKHNKWAWWIAFVLAILGILSGLTSVIALSIPGIGMFIVNIVVIIGLWNPKARKVCKVKFE